MNARRLTHILRHAILAVSALSGTNACHEAAPTAPKAPLLSIPPTTDAAAAPEAGTVHVKGPDGGIPFIDLERRDDDDQRCGMCGCNFYKNNPGRACGRRPTGFEENATHDHTITDWLTTAATLEAASVVAFTSLACELRALGAPEKLARAADRSAREERSHAALMNAALHARGHALARPPAIADTAPKTLEAFAIENAVEGTVGETFGVLLALYQAEHAKSEDVKLAMQIIARDEIKHAVLAFEIEQWVITRLSLEARERLERAKRQAIARLRESFPIDAMSENDRLALGLPDIATSGHMVDYLDSTAWNTASASSSA